MSRTAYHSVLIATLLFLFSCGPVLAQSGMRAGEEILVLPTYRAGAPDKNPIFFTGRQYQGAKGPVYPYPMIDVLTDRREDVPYRVAFLENEFLRIDVMPEIGGRIFTGRDKTNGYDFFYRQHVIKPALIGMAGAWISGGVEWNIPHHHRASSFMPVDWKIQENPDGSRTVWVGEMELRHRMKWVIGMTLRPGKSYLEVTVRLLNRTPLPHSALYFANPAVHANPDYQVLFPPSTEYATYHAKNQFIRWPVGDSVFRGIDYSRGVDLSWWKNHPSPISFFAWNYEDDFLAGYDHGRKAGVVHVASHHTVPGKKLWEWGNGPEGRMWDKILTETDGPYIEVMVGGYSDNQPDYSWMQPYETKMLTQYWYPIREIGGVKNATREAAVNLEIKPSGKAGIGFHSTAAHSGARARLEAYGKPIFEQVVSISPDRPFIQAVELPGGTREEDLRASLVSADGSVLVDYQPAPKKGEPMPEEVKDPPAPADIKSVEELYLTGLRLEQFYSPHREPYPYYEEALRRDPEDYRVNTALGVLYLKRAMLHEAEERLRIAVRRATHDHTRPKDGEAFYYLGAALRYQGKNKEAAEYYYKASWSLAWNSAAYHAIAELAAGKGDFAGALDLVERSLATNAWNTSALGLRASLLRRLGRAAEAEAAAARALELDPLDFRALNEIGLAKGSRGLREETAGAMRDLTALMRGEPQSYLELAVGYRNAGLLDEAIAVLDRYRNSVEDKNGVHPMAMYYLGSLQLGKGGAQLAAENFRTAASMKPDYCFPYRIESIEVLRQAAKANPADARAPYYLGNLLYDMQPESAIGAWEQARGLDGSFAPVFRNLAFAHAYVRGDAAAATAAMEKAVSLNPQDARFLLELDEYAEAAGVAPARRLERLDKHSVVVTQRDDAMARLLHLLVWKGDYDRAIGELKKRHFHVWEGGSGVRGIWEEAHLLRGRRHLTGNHPAEALRDFQAAAAYPENLEIARGLSAEFPEAAYYRALTQEALGNKQAATDEFEAAAKCRLRGAAGDYYIAMALRRLGREGEARAALESLSRAGQQRLEAPPAGRNGLERTLSRRSTPAQGNFLQGLAMLGLGRGAEARTHFQKTLKSEPGHIWAGAHLAEPR